MASIKESFTKGLTAINVKTNNFMEENKCRTYISTLENEIRELKLEIGEKVYEKWERQETPGTELAELLEQIKMKQQEILTQKEKIAQLHEQEKIILGTSGNQNSENGTVIYCSQCGMQNGINYKFCSRCGNSLKE